MDTFWYTHQLTQDVIGRIIFFIILAVPFVWSVVWAYKDAKRRGKSPILVALMIALLSWPASILVWLVFRPNKK